MYHLLTTNCRSKKVVKFVQVEDSVELEPNQTDPSSNCNYEY
ncbi:16421_t:CDS:2 [Entrophospora sp. SA101]|nr:16421_t:CDS:2 [Entrophospora sp. SA101]